MPVENNAGGKLSIYNLKREIKSGFEYQDKSILAVLPFSANWVSGKSEKW